MKCSMGNKKQAMNDELDCSKQNLNTWKDVVAKAAVQWVMKKAMN